MNNYTRLSTHHVHKIAISEIQEEDTYNCRRITVYGKDKDGDLVQAVEITVFADDIDNLKVNL
jgi:hypothetical protein